MRLQKGILGCYLIARNKKIYPVKNIVLQVIESYSIYCVVRNNSF